MYAHLFTRSDTRDSRADVLRKYRHCLDAEIYDELKHSASCYLQPGELKRSKLRLTDESAEIAEISRAVHRAWVEQGAH